MDITAPIHTIEQCMDKIKAQQQKANVICSKEPTSNDLADLRQITKEAEGAVKDLQRHIDRINLENICTTTST